MQQYESAMEVISIFFLYINLILSLRKAIDYQYKKLMIIYDRVLAPIIKLTVLGWLSR